MIHAVSAENALGYSSLYVERQVLVYVIESFVNKHHHGLGKAKIYLVVQTSTPGFDQSHMNRYHNSVFEHAFTLIIYHGNVFLWYIINWLCFVIAFYGHFMHMLYDM